ncbi:MAG: PEP-CTERM sorting domain-containing protein [Phycisphaerae bacterium]|nr:PEP-CTERM sorting domain-containing protein [Phycisphaerae bacterium]
MRARNLIRGVEVVLGLLTVAAVAGAAPYQHAGSTDPASEGWVLNDYTGLGGAVAPGWDSEAFWQTHGNAGSVQRYLQDITPADVNDPTGWTYTARVKANLATDILEASFGVIDGQEWWQVHLLTSAAAGVYLMNPDASTGPQLSGVDPSLEYHTYQIVFNPTGAGGGGEATYYVDGMATGSRMRGQNFNAGVAGLYRLDFGDNDRGATESDSQWALVRFELGQHPVPEPASILMVGLSGWLLVKRRSR